MDQAIVLVVEDELGVQRILKEMLAEEGFDVQIASNGAAALHMLEVINPDLIVTDLLMPELGGVGLIQQVRKQERFAQLPIVALSGYGQSLEPAAIAAGAT